MLKLFFHFLPLFNFQLFLQDPYILPKYKVYHFLSFKTIFKFTYLGLPCRISAFLNYKPKHIFQDHYMNCILFSFFQYSFLVQ